MDDLWHNHISESVTLLSPEVIYGIIAISKSTIILPYMQEICNSLLVICNISMISTNVGVLQEE